MTQFVRIFPTYPGTYPQPTVYTGIPLTWGFGKAWSMLQGYVEVLLDTSTNLSPLTLRQPAQNEIRNTGFHRSNTPPKFNIAPEKWWKITFLLGWFNFRGELSNIQGVTIHKNGRFTNMFLDGWISLLGKLVGKNRDQWILWISIPTIHGAGRFIMIYHDLSIFLQRKCW